jgi:hypothetical protein
MSVRHGLLLAAVLLAAGPARALDPAALDLQLRLRAAPEGTWENRGSPFAPAAGLTGQGAERGRGEVELRLRLDTLTADVAAHLTALQGSRPESVGVLNELFDDLELLGLHLTVGKKVLSWDVGYGFRPLDLVQQQDRRAFLPFALEGVPLLALERFGEHSATSLVYANPLRGTSPRSRDDEALALRHYQRMGGLDLHLVARWSRRSLGQGGLAGSWVPAELLELHASALYQRRLERPGDARLDPGASPIAAADPARVRVSSDALSALAGFTLTPGRDLSFLVEGWIDPAAATASEWRARAALARTQGRLLSDPAVPRAAVLGNLAWGARAFEGQNLVRENLLARVSQRWDRFEPDLDLLWTPGDGGLVATATLGWEGERTRLTAAARVYGGPGDAAVRLLPQRGVFNASWELRW